MFIYEEEQKDGRILRGLRFKFPIYMNGRNVLGVDWDNGSTDETVVLLSKLHEAKYHVNVTVDVDELDVTSAESKAAAMPEGEGRGDASDKR